MASIVIIDDDAAFRPMLAQMLGRLGHEVFAAENGHAGLKFVRARVPDLVITDMVMPEKEGVETIIELRRSYPALKIIAISGGGRINSADYLSLATKFGVAGTLAKPFGRDELKAVLEAVLA